jgi:hypothetical protein
MKGKYRHYILSRLIIYNLKGIEYKVYISIADRKKEVRFLHTLEMYLLFKLGIILNELVQFI